MQTKNPLRISQEFLDLDDIISDLNSEVSQQPMANPPSNVSEAIKTANNKEKIGKTNQTATNA